MNPLRLFVFAVVAALSSLPVAAQTIVTIGDPGLTTGLSAVAASPDSRALVAFVDGSTATVKVATCIDFVDCQPMIFTVDNRATGGKALAAAMGDDDLAILAYFDGDAVLHVATCLNQTCSSATIGDAFDTGDPTLGGNISIAIGADGNPVIAYYNQATTALKALMCSDPGCNFGVPRVIDGAGIENVGLFNDVAIGSDGNPVFSYYDASNSALKIAWCANPDCVTGGIVTRIVDDPPATDVGRYTSIALYDQTFPLVTYQDRTNMALKMLSCGDVTCDPSTAEIRVLDDPTAVSAEAGAYSQLVVPADQIPVVSYLRSNLLRDSLAVARCADSSCTSFAGTTRPDPGSDQTGLAISMTLGRGGLPLMSYYDLDSNVLKVLRCDSAHCDTIFAETFEEQAP